MKSRFLKILFAILFGVPADIAHAFPEMIRHGYGSCRACHYSPSGGGPINEYGEVQASEFLSTWGEEGEGETFYGLLVSPSLISVKGDFRYLYHHYRDDFVAIDQRFPMQREVSLIFNPSPEVSLLASGGYYGLDHELSYRRYYGIVRLGGFWARAGRYLPPFSMEIPDHTKSVKQLFSQGSETLNAELGYTGSFFESSFTRILGSDSKLRADSRPAVEHVDEREGFVGKLSVFIYKGLAAHFSHLVLRDNEFERRFSSAGMYMGWGSLYAYYEYQSHPSGESKQYGYAGWEFIKGAHARVEVDNESDPKSEKLETFGTLLWYPRPHWEFSGSMSEKQYYFVSHYYL